MTRDMFLMLLHKMEGRPVPRGSVRFSDVAHGALHHDPVIWAAESGILGGIAGIAADGAFMPKSHVTRQEMAVALLNYAGYKGYDVPKNRDMPPYADYDQIDAWARAATRMLSEAGVMGGVGDRFMPHERVNGFEVAQTLKDFVRFVAGTSQLDPCVHRRIPSKS
uniref:SLH domain-containing protein n=1 Tax=uncultured bacterium contig00146 TaxID=1181586 RepID=A0A806KKR5_9BACT|nr:hypothetical protein [uncultured bacterium contig00146]